MSTSNQLSISITGTILRIGETVDKGKQKSFLIREVIVEVADDKFPQTLKLEFTGDRGVSLPDDFNVGDRVKCGINIRGRAYNDSVFNQLNVWSMNAAPQEYQQHQQAPQQQYQQPQQQQYATTSVKTYAAPPAPVNQQDDLPF